MLLLAAAVLALSPRLFFFWHFVVWEKGRAVGEGHGERLAVSEGVERHPDGRERVCSRDGEEVLRRRHS